MNGNYPEQLPEGNRGTRTSWFLRELRVRRHRGAPAEATGTPACRGRGRLAGSGRDTGTAGLPGYRLLRPTTLVCFLARALRRGPWCGSSKN